ncbi:MAG TPA: PIG-L family deacetylase, partial [Phycisphaerae bacterium]|nr:PIG-L family deacetylase [Phycisphaerae bacterium]
MSEIAIAVAAHPDDIEFMMGGTLLLLGLAGCELHYMTVANGSCGSVTADARRT